MELSCELFLLLRDAYLYPHTDKPEKLVSFLLYFVEPDWESHYDGATDLYRARECETRPELVRSIGSV